MTSSGRAWWSRATSSPVRGHYGGVEDSFMVMVPEADKDDMVRLGKSFSQDSG